MEGPRRHNVAEEELISLDELFRELIDFQQVALGVILSSDWKELAGKLGLSNEESRTIEVAVNCENRGYEVLKRWRRGPNTTIRVLHVIIDDMGNDDAAKKLWDVSCGEFYFYGWSLLMATGGKFCQTKVAIEVCRTISCIASCFFFCSRHSALRKATYFRLRTPSWNMAVFRLPLRLERL